LRIADPRGHRPRIRAALKSQRKWGFEGAAGKTLAKIAKIAKVRKVKFQNSSWRSWRSWRENSPETRNCGSPTPTFNALTEGLYVAFDRVGVSYALQKQMIALLAPMQRDIVKR
jgi:hypothetical protein